MTTTLPHPDAFADLVAAYLDGRIGPAEHRIVDHALTTSAEHRAIYRELVALESLLAWDRRWGGAGAVFLQTHPSLDRPASAGRITPFRINRTAFALAAVLLLAAIAVAVYIGSWTDAPSAVNDQRSPLASILDVSDHATLMVDGQIAVAGELYAGRTIMLDAGEAEFMLASQVGVRLRGNSSLTIHSPMHAAMTRGSATFDCPPAAKGFTVHLPDGSRIVDLGTAFRVDVDDRRRAVLRVLAGQVKWVSARTDTDPVLVDAGGAIRIQSGRAQAVTVASPLIAHWKFDEGSGTTAFDSSPLGNDATGSAGGQWIAGKIGSAYQLGGTTSHFALADSTDLQVTGAVSVAVWVKSWAASNFGVIAGIDATGGTAHDMYTLKTDGVDKLWWSVIGPGTNVSLVSTDKLFGVGGLNEGDVWVHVVAVYDPTGFAALYINGLPDVSTTSVPTSIQLKTATPFRMGHNAADTGHFPFNGAIDDVQVYRAALSSRDARFLFENPGEPLAVLHDVDPRTQDPSQRVVGSDDHADHDGPDRQQEATQQGAKQ